MAILDMLEDDEAYLWAILSDESGLDQAEFMTPDEDRPDGCFRAWPYQWPWFRCRDPLQIDQGARSAGKSLSVKLRAIAFPFIHPQQELVLTAPEGNHLDALTDKIETAYEHTRLLREMLVKGRTGIKHRPFNVSFRNGASIKGRIPQKTGIGMKGMHPIWLELDEGQDYPEAGWRETFETVLRPNEGEEAKHRWRVHGVTRGVRDKFYDFTQPDSGFTVHWLPAMYRPGFTDEERQEKILQYGHRDSPDFRRNVYGLHGDASSPLFVFHRLMEAVDSDESSDYNNNVYDTITIDEADVRAYTDIIQLLTLSGSHKRYSNFWIGMDVGYTQAPSAIVIFAEDKESKNAVTKLRLIARILLKKISHEDQVKTITYLINEYRPLAFAMDKMQPVSEPVLTPSGWVALGDLNVGDYVIGSNGQPTQITGYFPQEDRRVLRINLSDGTSVRCGPEHLWTVTARRGRKTHERNTFTTEQLQSLSSDGWKIEFPYVSSPVEFSKQEELPIDPYVLGCLLGDGNLREHGIRFSSVDQEVIDRFNERLPEGYGLAHTDRCNYILRGPDRGRSSDGRFSNDHLILNQLRELGLCGKLSQDKFIPAQYLAASVEDRIDLLRGLMDTDGHCDINKDGYNIGFRSSSEALVDGVRELVRSLGGSATVPSPQKIVIKGHRYLDQHRTSINLLDINPFYLSRKAERVTPRNAPRRFMKDVLVEQEEESACIRVAAEDHLYVTKDFIVTHNTGLGLPLFQDIQQLARKNPDISHIVDRIKGYGFSEKLVVEYDDTIKIDENDPDGHKKAEIRRNVLEYSSDVLRSLVDDKRLILPWDRDLIGEFQGQTWNYNTHAVDMYGRKKSYSQGAFHTLDACRMAVLAYKQNVIEQFLKNHEDTWEPPPTIFF